MITLFVPPLILAFAPVAVRAFRVGSGQANGLTPPKWRLNATARWLRTSCLRRGLRPLRKRYSLGSLTDHSEELTPSADASFLRLSPVTQPVSGLRAEALRVRVVHPRRRPGHRERPADDLRDVPDPALPPGRRGAEGGGCRSSPAAGSGSGENLSEHVVGKGWPAVGTRHEMFSEAIDIISGSSTRRSRSTTAASTIT
jgi:hypothetical protein